MISPTSVTIPIEELFPFLLAILSLLLFAHLMGYLFEQIKLPRVVGEITGGILLGPSVLGFLEPNIYMSLFNAFEDEGQLIGVIYALGLIFLMFIAGFEIQKSFDKTDRELIGLLIACTTVIPLIIGWLLFNSFDFSFLLGIQQNMLALQIVFVISIAVTSIPVISKIFMDLDLSETRFAKIVLSSATAHDLVLYGGLAVATGLVANSSTNTTLTVVSLIATTVIFFVVALLVVSKIMNHVEDSRWNFLKKSSPAGYGIFICLAFCAVAIVIHVNVMFGALLAGICISILPKRSLETEKAGLKTVALGLFIPVYFAVVGLQLDLIHHFDVTFFCAFLLVSSLIQIFSTLVAAKLARLDMMSSVNLAITMNARGGPGIVLATSAFAVGIISENFFVTLILTAMTTSLVAGWWLRSRVGLNKDLLKI